MTGCIYHEADLDGVMSAAKEGGGCLGAGTQGQPMWRRP